jgi:hypothetical protein
MIITACGVAIVAKLMQFINGKIDVAQTKVKNEKVNWLIDKTQDVITTAVQSVSQTYVSTLKNEGKFDGVAAQEAKKRALEIIDELLTIDARKAIESTYGDVDTYINHAVEEAVRWSR